MVTIKRFGELAKMPVKFIMLGLIFMSMIFTVAAAGMDSDEVIAVGYFYNVNDDTLTVNGYTTENWYGRNIFQLKDAKSVKVNIINSSMSISEFKCVSVNSDYEYSAVFSGISELRADTYQIKVNFYDSNGCSGHEFSEVGFGGEFNVLIINELREKVSSLEVQVTELESDLNKLESDLGDVNETLGLEITNLNSDLIDLSNELHSLINLTLTQLETEVSAIETELTNLNTKITNLKNSLNTATINLRYKAELRELDVWGKAPQGATQAVLKIKDTENNSVVYIEMSTSVKTYEGFENSYQFTRWNSNGVNISELDEASYNVEVTFTGVSGSFKTSVVFTNLELEGIQNSLSVMRLDIVNLTIAVDDNTNNITHLWNETEQLWIAVEDLKSENLVQWNHIGAL